MKILVINGPNLDRLGMREKNIYGSLKLNEINEIIQNNFKNKNTFIDFIQSNDEGRIISAIGNSEEKYNGIVINPGAYSHYSIGILDAIRGINIPVVEVHLSNIHSREEYRRKTITGEGCLGVISGFGHYSYIMAINALIDFYSKN